MPSLTPLVNVSVTPSLKEEEDYFERFELAAAAAECAAPLQERLQADGINIEVTSTLMLLTC